MSIISKVIYFSTVSLSACQIDCDVTKRLSYTTRVHTLVMLTKALARNLVFRRESIPRRQSLVLKISNISRGTLFSTSTISLTSSAAFSWISVSCSNCIETVDNSEVELTQMTGTVKWTMFTGPMSLTSAFFQFMDLNVTKSYLNYPCKTKLSNAELSALQDQTTYDNIVVIYAQFTAFYDTQVRECLALKLPVHIIRRDPASVSLRQRLKRETSICITLSHTNDPIQSLILVGYLSPLVIRW